MLSLISLAGMEGQSWIVIILVNAVALIISASLINGVYIKGFGKAVIVAIVLALLNATVGAFLKVLTYPISVITLGIFTFVVNAFVLRITGKAFILSLILALINGVLFTFI